MNKHEKQVIYRVSNPLRNERRLFMIADSSRTDTLADVLAAMLRGDRCVVVLRDVTTFDRMTRDVPFDGWPGLHYAHGETFVDCHKSHGSVRFVRAGASEEDVAGLVVDRVYYCPETMLAQTTAKGLSMCRLRPTADERIAGLVEMVAAHVDELGKRDARIGRLKGQIAELERRASDFSETYTIVENGRAHRDLVAGDPVFLAPPSSPPFDAVTVLAAFMLASSLGDEAMAALGQALAELATAQSRAMTPKPERSTT